MSKLVRFLCASVVAIAVIGMSSASWAGDRDHSGGFFLRFVLGAGAATAKTDALPAEFSGTSGVVDAAIGGLLTENLALHFTIFGWSITDDNVDVGGVSGTADIDLFAAGVGVTYYFMPQNVYLSGSVGKGELTGSGAVDGEIDSGLATSVSVGKEWWAGRRWGLGISGVVGFLSLPVVNESWSGWSWAVAFSATFN